jgi:hypothetical protein
VSIGMGEDAKPTGSTRSTNPDQTNGVDEVDEVDSCCGISGNPPTCGAANPSKPEDCCARDDQRSANASDGDAADGGGHAHVRSEPGSDED